MPLGQLHGERVISMFNSFQLKRSVRLRLTHQRRKDAKACRCQLFGEAEALALDDGFDAYVERGIGRGR